jgi:hypothetical protein
MMHYFDDTFSRHTNARSGTQTPRLRRSSTARSLAMRSDFSADEDEEDDSAYTPRRSSVGASSVMLDDPVRAKEREEADAHMHKYISDQLERVSTARDEEWYTSADEIEARPE